MVEVNHRHHSMVRRTQSPSPSGGGQGGGLRGRPARGTPTGQLIQGPAEPLHVLVDVEHLIGADRSFLGGLGETVGMLGLLEQEDRDEAYFFFQAEDGIRDYKVTGVQTCALPI